MFYTCFIMFPLSARLKHLLKECFTWMGAFGRDEPKPTRLLTNFLDFGIRLKRRLPIAARVGMTNGRNVHLEVRDGIKKVTGRPNRIKETQVYSTGYPVFLPVGSPTLPRIGFLSPDRSPPHRRQRAARRRVQIGRAGRRLPRTHSRPRDGGSFFSVRAVSPERRCRRPRDRHR